MIVVEPTREQVQYCRSLLEESGSIGNRGEFDGNSMQQLFGLIAQVIVGDMIGYDRPQSSQGFDGGWDVIYKGKKVDVKCEVRNVAYRKSWPHNLKHSQITYPECEGYIFVSYNQEKGEYAICGYISKEELKDKGEHFREGSQRKRADGTFLTVKGKGGMCGLMMTKEFYDAIQQILWQAYVVQGAEQHNVEDEHKLAMMMRTE